ncbi:hypothetical protein GF318_06240 [Candidatus Micrarchaeota archaeon]|nr:hypothetical protein [Candidatus Micrarchaeota archaeon]
MTSTSSKKYIYASLGVGIVGAIFSLAAGGSFFSLIGAFLCFVGTMGAALFWKYGYMIIPLITQRTNIIMMDRAGYEIPPSQDVIVKNVGGVYYASVFLGIKIFESTTEKASDDAIAYNQFFERAISNIKHVTKIAYMLYVEDVAQKRRNIEAKRAEAQLRLARERDKPQADPLTIDKYEREVAIWDMQLQRLIRGVKPMGVMAYAQTTATGLSKDAAIAAARSQSNELRTLLGNALNVEVTHLTGDQMLKCFEWEKFYPTSPQELEESVV